MEEDIPVRLYYTMIFKALTSKRQALMYIKQIKTSTNTHSRCHYDHKPSMMNMLWSYTCEEFPACSGNWKSVNKKTSEPVVFCDEGTTSMDKGRAMVFIWILVRPLTQSLTTPFSLNWRDKDLMDGLLTDEELVEVDNGSMS